MGRLKHTIRQLERERDEAHEATRRADAEAKELESWRSAALKRTESERDAFKRECDTGRETLEKQRREFDQQLALAEEARMKAEKKAEIAIETGKRAIGVVSSTVERTKHGVETAFAAKDAKEEDLKMRASQALESAHSATVRASEESSQLETEIREKARSLSIHGAKPAATESLPPEEDPVSRAKSRSGDSAFTALVESEFAAVMRADGANAAGDVAKEAGRVLNLAWQAHDGGAWQALLGETFTATALAATLRAFYMFHASAARVANTDSPPALSSAEAIESHKLEKQLGWRRIGLNRKVNRTWSFLRGDGVKLVEAAVLATAGSLDAAADAVVAAIGKVDAAALCDDWAAVAKVVTLSDVKKTSKENAVAVAMYVYCTCLEKKLRGLFAA